MAVPRFFARVHVRVCAACARSKYCTDALSALRRTWDAAYLVLQEVAPAKDVLPVIRCRAPAEVTADTAAVPFLPVEILSVHVGVDQRRFAQCSALSGGAFTVPQVRLPC